MKQNHAWDWMFMPDPGGRARWTTSPVRCGPADVNQSRGVKGAQALLCEVEFDLRAGQAMHNTAERAWAPAAHSWSDTNDRADTDIGWRIVECDPWAAKHSPAVPRNLLR